MADDGFERYFAEKLWEMIPAVYRHQDGLANNPGVLRALVQVFAEQAAVLRRSHDRLWEDQFIELCDDWAIPYIGDLVGTRMVSALMPRARRVDVAKTIYYRRRAGTPAILEELISDIAGWEGTLVEGFRRLGRCRHRLDPVPAPLAGRHTGTPPGGWADLRQVWAAKLAGTAFDEFHHTPDLRRPRGKDGRYGIHRIAFHLYRLKAFSVSGATPCQVSGSKGFTFDPSGRDIPLFMPRNRPQDPPSDNDDRADWTRWRPAREWELPGPLRCRVLRMIQAGDAPVLQNDVLSIEEAFGGAIATEHLTAGRLDDWSAKPSGKRVVIDPERGRFLFLAASPPEKVKVAYHYGFSGEIGAGTYDRRSIEQEGRAPAEIPTGGGQIKAEQISNNGVTRIKDSATYGPVAEKKKVTNLLLQAVNRERPYVRLGGDWRLTGAHENAELVLDGLWIGAKDDSRIILQGEYKSVTLRHVTLDPGGRPNDDLNADDLPAVSLVIKGHVERLTIESSITGPIRTEDNGSVEEISVSDSIIHADMGLELDGGKVDLKRVTVLGKLEVHRLWATEVLVAGQATVTDTQTGCFRFSAAPKDSHLPRPYESHWLEDVKAAEAFFVSQRFGHPGYAQLSEAAPVALKRGAENGSEIGAFSRLLNPIKLDSLKAKVEEFMPFGLLPIFIYET